MKKVKILIVISMLTVASVLLSACLQPASTGEVTPQDDDELQSILDAVAQQTPAGPDDGTGGNPSVADSLAQTQTAEAAIPTPALPDTDLTPEPTPTFVPAAGDKTIPESYALKAGEFPWCIARRFNIDPVALLNFNGLSGREYSIGQVLAIPSAPGTFEGERMLALHPTTYTIRSGDTFNSIACLFGDVWPEDIAARNGMSINDALTAGETIEIP